ncbi:MAG TPA: YitT family protein [Ruminococcaceae bacterium]|nr:YitT family protein [Oscillospiraceae bacterium]
MIAGSAVFAASVTVFSAPNEIAPGGLTGIATVLNYLFAWPIGTAILIMNIPVFLIGAAKLGIKFLAKTLFASVLVSVFIDLFTALIPAYTGNPMLAAIYGGLLSGTGLALVFLRGGTTGGADIAAKLISLKFPHISVGRIFLILDLCVILFATAVYRNVESGLYAIIFIFVSSQLVDRILYGADKGKIMLVISGRSKEIAGEIMLKLSRGVTLLKASGAYTGEDKQVLMCAVRLSETARLHTIVKSLDRDAFIIVADAGEISGEGFKPIV